jgi:hypothetical protein
MDDPLAVLHAYLRRTSKCVRRPQARPVKRTLGDIQDDERAHMHKPDRGRARQKEVIGLLGRAGVRQSTLNGEDVHGLCFWVCLMLEFDERSLAGEARRNSVLNMRNLIWLMLVESPAVCMQPLKRLHALAKAVGHNKSLAKTRARFNYLWKNGFTRVLVQGTLLPSDFEHRLRPIQLIDSYDCAEYVCDTASSVSVCKQRKRRARPRPAITHGHALPLRGAGVELAPRRQRRLDRRRNGLGRPPRPE